MEHPNAKLVREAYDAFSRGDIGAIQEKYFAPDILFVVPGNGEVSGEFRGQPAVLEMLGRLMQVTGGTFKLEVHDVTGSEDHAVGLCNISGTRNGKQGGYRNVHIADIKDGKISEWYEQPEVGKFDEFWA